MMLRVEDIAFRHGQGEMILDGVSLSLAAGEIISLLGPNGTGKSSLLRCILGLARPQRGLIAIAGQDIATLSRRQAARLVAYVPQSTQCTEPITVRDLVLMGRTAHLGVLQTPGAGDRAIVDAILEKLGIEHLAHRSVTRISGGERQIALLARALAQEARILVLDEPTASLDYGNQLKVLEAIRTAGAEGHSILCATHAPDHALFLGGRAALLKSSRLIAFGSTDTVLTTQALSDLYGVPVAVVSHAADGMNRKILIPFPHQQLPTQVSS